MTSNLINFQQ